MRPECATESGSGSVPTTPGPGQLATVVVLLLLPLWDYRHGDAGSSRSPPRASFLALKPTSPTTVTGILLAPLQLVTHKE